jgi:hypothetical protein
MFSFSLSPFFAATLFPSTGLALDQWLLDRVYKRNVCSSTSYRSFDNTWRTRAIDEAKDVGMRRSARLLASWRFALVVNGPPMDRITRRRASQTTQTKQLIEALRAQLRSHNIVPVTIVPAAATATVAVTVMSAPPAVVATLPVI